MKNRELKEMYAELLSMNWKGKNIWERICDNDLTAAPHFMGELYGKNNNFKLMVVGRAVNGWEYDFDSCESEEDVLNAILNQTFTFEDIVKEEGIQGEKSTYFYSKSPFWRLIRKLLESYGEGENYNKKVLWSNLYKIAPRNGGNPGWLLIRPELQTYIDMIKKEIEIYKPTHILFITDIGYFNPYPLNSKYPRFGENLNVNEICGYDYVVAEGQYEKVKIVVCKRPEQRNTDNMVMEIKKVFDDMIIEQEG